MKMNQRMKNQKSKKKIKKIRIIFISLIILLIISMISIIYLNIKYQELEDEFLYQEKFNNSLIEENIRYEEDISFYLDKIDSLRIRNENQYQMINDLISEEDILNYEFD